LGAEGSNNKAMLSYRANFWGGAIARARAGNRKVQNVQVADCRQKKCVMDTNIVGEYSLKLRNDRTADDPGHQQAQSSTC